MTGSFLAARYTLHLGAARMIARGAALAAVAGVAMATLVATGHAGVAGLLATILLLRATRPPGPVTPPACASSTR